MTPATLALIVSLVEEAITEAPAAYAAFQAVFSKPNPTAADWEALRATVLSQSYASLVPDSKLAPDAPPTV
jgi:hypothetical protein